jgi:hypothetical protein
MEAVMVRKATPGQVLADRYFPVRLRVAVPERGFGRRLDDMHTWLDESLGHGTYFVWSERGPPEAALFYFPDLPSAHAFIDRFACGLAALPNAGPEDRPR